MRIRLTAGALALALSGAAMAADPQVQSDLDALKAQVQQQAQEIQQLRAQSGESWLNERRAEEIKSLIHEVLSDAETRAAFAEGGLTAGWRDHFFMASEDGNFLLRLSGQEQIRYTLGDANRGESEHSEGFENRRTMLSFDGHLFDPKFTYQISLLMSDEHEGFTSGGFAVVQNAWAAYEFADGWQVKLGQFKAPFMRDELVHSSKQLAVERGYLTDLVTVDYSQGAQIGYNGELVDTPVRAALMVHDGSYSANGTPPVFAEDTDFAVASRIEVLLAGEWEQFDDYATWSDDAFGLLVGAAVDYENAEGEDSTTGNDLLKWTVDGSVEVPEAWGFNATAAITGIHTDDRNDPSSDDADQFVTLVQAGLFIIPDKLDIFGRWEFADLEGDFLGTTSPLFGLDAEEIHLLTFGGNYYFQRHAAKVSADITWLMDETAPLSSVGGQDIDTGDTEDRLFFRAQFQFLF